MDTQFKALAGITLAPYIEKATALISVQRRSGSNMFRHQLSTMAILLDYKMFDAVLLKASVIHDLFENAANLPGATEREIASLDADGPAVYALVTEVTIRMAGEVKEPKADYLRRVMQAGSRRARLLKLADRISNLTALGFVHDPVFVRRYLDETKQWVLPFAGVVNPDMWRELTDLVENRERLLPALRADAERPD
ncbi:MAG TPA: HD domain-containing protein [Vicinamibacterales bacterium]|nr:HD domain-containing protein [Vicinamibacterales bacterium]